MHHSTLFTPYACACWLLQLQNSQNLMLALATYCQNVVIEALEQLVTKAYNIPQQQKQQQDTVSQATYLLIQCNDACCDLVCCSSCGVDC